MLETRHAGSRKTYQSSVAPRKPNMAVGQPVGQQRNHRAGHEGWGGKQPERHVGSGKPVSVLEGHLERFECLPEQCGSWKTKHDGGAITGHEG